MTDHCRGSKNRRHPEDPSANYANSKVNSRMESCCAVIVGLSTHLLELMI